jgi:hypothetical protein
MMQFGNEKLKKTKKEKEKGKERKCPRNGRM